MNRKMLSAVASISALSLVALASVRAIADAPQDAKATAQPDFKLPPGWTAADMQACVAAGTPGKMHELLAKGIGQWQAKTTMWMAPGFEPMTSEGASTVSAMMDGRFIKVEMTGEMPGMGPYNGLGVYGFDNVSQKFVSTWIDNHGTGIMQGTGELSADGKTTTWKYTGNCPITKQPVVMREIETITGPDSKTLEMFGPEPKTGKEYKVMRIELTRKR